MLKSQDKKDRNSKLMKIRMTTNAPKTSKLRKSKFFELMGWNLKDQSKNEIYSKLTRIRRIK